MTRRNWTVRLSDTAEADYDDILRWTEGRFGAAQATALARLERGPATAGARQRDAIGPGVRTLHVGRRGRHVNLFRIGSERDRTIDVLRVLHDAMDLARHVALDR